MTTDAKSLFHDGKLAEAIEAQTAVVRDKPSDPDARAFGNCRSLCRVRAISPTRANGEISSARRVGILYVIRSGTGKSHAGNRRFKLKAALISPRCVNACGKFPTSSPFRPISSEYSPTWLA